jgi:hypothetical protein
MASNDYVVAHGDIPGGGPSAPRFGLWWQWQGNDFTLQPGVALILFLRKHRFMCRNLTSCSDGPSARTRSGGI